MGVVNSIAEACAARGRSPYAFRGFGLTAVCTFFLLCVPMVSAQVTKTVRSGNGLSGGTDSEVSMLIGPVEAPFPSPFTPADFQSAATGPPAFIVQPHSGWAPALPADPDAKWVGSVPSTTIEASSALFAISFDLGVSCFQSASLDVSFAIDDSLGWGTAEGIYLNGTPIASTVAAPGISTVVSWSGLDVSNAVVSGQNTLYFYAVNTLDPGGIIFSATITASSGGCWVDLGDALAGSHGSPLLEGVGLLTPLSLVDLALSSAKPFAPTTLVVGASTLRAPFKAGVLVPNPDLLFAMTADFFGAAHLSALWPPGIPPGFEFYAQYWILDSAGPLGFAASNAVRATTP